MSPLWTIFHLSHTFNDFPKKILHFYSHIIIIEGFYFSACKKLLWAGLPFYQWVFHHVLHGRVLRCWWARLTLYFKPPSLMSSSMLINIHKNYVPKLDGLPNQIHAMMDQTILIIIKSQNIVLSTPLQH